MKKRLLLWTMGLGWVGLGLSFGGFYLIDQTYGSSRYNTRNNSNYSTEDSDSGKQSKTQFKKKAISKTKKNPSKKKKDEDSGSYSGHWSSMLSDKEVAKYDNDDDYDIENDRYSNDRYIPEELQSTPEQEDHDMEKLAENDEEYKHAKKGEYTRAIHTALKEAGHLTGSKTSMVDSAHRLKTRSGGGYDRPNLNEEGVELINIPREYIEISKSKNSGKPDAKVKPAYFQDIAQSVLGDGSKVTCSESNTGGTFTGFLYVCKKEGNKEPLMIVKELLSASEKTNLQKVIDDEVLLEINKKDKDLPHMTYNTHTFGYMNIVDVKNQYSYEETEKDLKNNMHYLTILQPAAGMSLSQWVEEFQELVTGDKEKTITDIQWKKIKSDSNLKKYLEKLKKAFHQVGRSMAAFHIQTAKLNGDKRADKWLSDKAYQHRDAHWNNIFYDEKDGVSLIDNETLVFSINEIQNKGVSISSIEKGIVSSGYDKDGDWYSRLYETPMFDWDMMRDNPKLMKMLSDEMIDGYVSKFSPKFQKNINEKLVKFLTDLCKKKKLDPKYYPRADYDLKKIH